MASVVDAYSACPCGSGQKFKWCCQNVEAQAEKAERLYARGQVEPALAAVEEGLRKTPDSFWLLTLKAIIHLQREQPDQARAALEKVLAKQPGHLGAQLMIVRATAEAEGAVAGIAQLQRALTACSTEDRPGLAGAAQLIGVILADEGHTPAARKHLELAASLAPQDSMITSSLRMLDTNPTVSPWARNPYTLSPAPERLGGEARARFDEAVSWAGDGLWSSAAAAFETLADEAVEAERNLGLCRLWLADDEGAVEALRRAVARLGKTAEAVDLEALAQLISPVYAEDLIEHVHKIWTLKRRDELLAKLRASDWTAFEGSGPLDPDDPKSFQVDQFALLDRPKPKSPDDPTAHPIARILVGSEIVILDVLDDGRLDSATARFLDLAGLAIPPAHPKTKLVDRVPRHASALSVELWLPEDMPEDEKARRYRQESSRVVREVWPETPMPAFDGRTPRQAAGSPESEVPLRAALLQLESTARGAEGQEDVSALRSSLGVPDEPPIDPATVDIAALHLARFGRVPVDRLDDDRLIAFWKRARAFMLPQSIEAAARAILERPALLDRPDVGRVGVISDLASITTNRGDLADGLEWIARGKRDEPSDARARNAVLWDLLELRLRARAEPPEAWVPFLAVVMERHGQDRSTGSSLLMTLVDLGLLQMQPNPDNPDQIMLDSRPLQAVLSRYGPKVTTAAGTLGVSASSGGIWTPGSATGGGGGLWTPGGPTNPPAGGDKPKLIVPGR